MAPLHATTALLAPLAALAGGPLAARVVAAHAGGRRVPATGLMVAVLAALFGWSALVVPAGWILATSLCLAWFLACLAMIDLVVLRLPDLLTLPLLVGGLIVAAFLPGAPIVDHLVGAGLGYTALALLAWGYRRLRGVDGVGLGDAKLLAAAGAWLGWRGLPSVLLIACLIAFLWVGVERLRRGARARRAAIAFGAPLSAALWIVWLHGPLTI